MKITKEHLGKRLLIKEDRYLSCYEVWEAGIMEISPSGKNIKIQFVKNDGTTFTDWVKEGEYVIVEVLASKAEQIADAVKTHISSKDYSDIYTVTQKEYQRAAEKALELDRKKQEWIHGMCNPPSPDWKKRT